MRESLAASFVAVASVALAGEPQKKLIEWGWDEPDTKFIRENVERMEQFPFDGLIFHVVSSRGGNFTWEMWGGRRFELAEFEHAVENLNATKFRRLADRFLRVNVTPGDADWFDEEGWATVRHNFGVAAQLANEGGCRGFMFDVEQYNAGLFSYAKQKHRDAKTFAEHQAQVRRRGREWMEEVGGHFPEITILLTFGYKIAQPPEGKDRSESHYGLLADFLDGMLEVCSPKTKIVDAWEYSYPYRERGPFEDAYATIKEKSLGWTAAPEKYRAHVEAGFGIWMDCRWRQVGWNADDFSKNHFTPEQFEASVRSALEVSDRYVWIYTEQPRWWTDERLPRAYVEALQHARSRIAKPDEAAQRPADRRPEGFDPHRVLRQMGVKGEAGVPEDRVDSYRSIFARIDQDGDGKLTPKEYVDDGSYMTPQVRRAIFRASDGNGDGVVTEREYVLNRIITDEAKQIFTPVDADNSGVLSKAEFVENSRLGDRQLAENVFQHLDLDANGELVIPEYLRVWGGWARGREKKQGNKE
ncbi:MAG TPA: EF-hand domain-containing protein [Thermoguttaceae bacterium]|nr:EF-hand domain-containing protein [Thermoguttaceae bacterium]